jgi:multidrug transporter EmrE-like cation transporter
MDLSLFFVIILSVVEIFGDFNLRFYAQTGTNSYLYYGLFGYAGVVYFLIQSLKYGNVLYVNSMWDGVSGLIESLAAYYFLGDRLENPVQYAGVLFVIVGIVLMKWQS